MTIANVTKLLQQEAAKAINKYEERTPGLTKRLQPILDMTSMSIRIVKMIKAIGKAATNDTLIRVARSEDDYVKFGIKKIFQRYVRYCRLDANATPIRNREDLWVSNTALPEDWDTQFSTYEMWWSVYFGWRIVTENGMTGFTK